MNRRGKTEVFLDCLKQFRLPAGLFFLNSVLIFVIFRLYGAGTEPFWYAFAVTFICMATVFVICLVKARNRSELRRMKLESILSEWNSLPPPENLSETDYREMIERLGAETEKLCAAFAKEQRDTQDFYTAWVHQIKTPIAVMKLALGSAEELDRRALLEELFRIEQYTDMALAYQRLGSSTNDLLIDEYPLDDLIREVIRKYASQFIYKKLKLVYEGTDLRIVTDKKWFVSMLEQLISNAIKYTSDGTVTVSVRDGVLSVSDTGVGIAPEDLPRIFEKGYTGVNGRLNDKASGLGLYLCGKAANLLSIPVCAESELGKGSCFSLTIRDKVTY